MRERSWWPLLTVAGALGVVSVLGGCGTSGSDESTDLAGFQGLVEQQLGYPISELREHELSAGAVEIIEGALDRGRLTEADQRAATELTFACFDAMGVTYDRIEVTDPRFPPGVTFQFRAPKGTDPDDRTWLNAADSCQVQNNVYVDAIYDAQPMATQARETWFADAPVRAEVLACLEDAGAGLPEGASYQQVSDAAYDVMTRLDNTTCFDILFGSQPAP